MENKIKNKLSEILDDFKTYSLSEPEAIERIMPLFGETKKENKTIILCAAIWFKDEIKHNHQPKNIDSGIVVCGRRHHNCYTTAYELNNNSSVKDCHEANAKAIQGFLTNDNLFVDRKEAGSIAFLAGQIDKPTDCLFSEDLY